MLFYIRILSIIFRTFLKAYVQPISPKWFPNGSKFLEQYGKNPPIQALELAQQRVKNSKLTISQIPRHELELVAEFLGGKTTNPVKGSVHYITSQANIDDDELMAREKQVEFAKSRNDLDKPVFYNCLPRRHGPAARHLQFVLA